MLQLLKLLIENVAEFVGVIAHVIRQAEGFTRTHHSPIA